MTATNGSTKKRMGLDSIGTGRVVTPIRITLIGQPGAGKTTFGAGAEAAIILPVEEGSNNLDVARFPTPESFADVREAIATLINDKHEYKTLVIDGIDALEALVWKHICAENNQKSVESFGYGRGYTEALGTWRILLSACDDLRRKRGMNIILIGHTVIKPFNDPSLPESYDRYEMRLHKSAAGLLSQWSDIFGFAVHDDVVVKGERKAVGTGERILRVHHSPSADAKNRHGITKDLELSWTALMDAIKENDPATALALRNEIATYIPKLPEEKRRAAIDFVGAAGNDVKALRKALATCIALAATPAPIVNATVTEETAS